MKTKDRFLILPALVLPVCLCCLLLLLFCLGAMGMGWDAEPKTAWGLVLVLGLARWFSLWGVRKLKWVWIAVFAASARPLHTFMMGAMSWCLMQQKTLVRMSLGRETSLGDRGARDLLL